MGVRRFINRVHFYLGILAAVPLILLSLSGAALVFEKELDRALNPSISYVTPGAITSSWQGMLDTARATVPDSEVVFLSLPLEPEFAAVFSTGDGRDIHFDPYTGEALGVRQHTATLMGFIHEFHVSFFAGKIGSYIGGSSALVLIASLLTGLVLWWPRVRRKREAFQIKSAASPRRRNLDLHRVLGFYFAPIVFLIALTGAMFTFQGIARPLVFALTQSQEASYQTEVPVPDDPVHLPIDDILAAADRHIPEAVPTGIAVPLVPGEAMRVNNRLPRQQYDTGRTYLFVDPYRGGVVGERSPRTRSRGEDVLSWLLHLHLGFFGGPYGSWTRQLTRIIWLVAALMPTFLAITGFRIWWGQHRTRRRLPVSSTPKFV